MSRPILVLSDIHENMNYVRQAEYLFSTGKYDRVICLGDYFDSFDGVTENTHVIIDWLSKKQHDSNWNFLWGNHDLQYFYNRPEFRCSGYEETRQILIHFSDIKVERFKFFQYQNGWLLSHAGLSWKYIGKVNKRYIESFLVKKESEMKYSLKNENQHTWIYADDSPLWNRWTGNTKENILPKINQLFGHTFRKNIRIHEVQDTDENLQYICMDTGAKHYAEIYPDETINFILR